MNFDNNSDNKSFGKTLKISDKLKNIEINKFQNSALNALKNQNHQNQNKFSKKLNKNNEDFSSEEYEIRKAAITKSRILKANNITPLIKDPIIDENANIKPLKPIDENNRDIKNIIDDKITEPNKNLDSNDANNNDNDHKQTNNDENNNQNEILKEFHAFQKNEKIDWINNDNKQPKQNYDKKNKSKPEVKQDDESLDKYLDSLALENKKIFKPNNETNGQRTRNSSYNNNNSSYQQDNNAQRSFSAISGANQQYNSGINHRALIEKRNKIEEKERAEEEKNKSKVKAALFQEQRKRNTNFRASVLNVVDENNEEILYGNKFGKKTNLKKKSKDQQNLEIKFAPKEILVQSENSLKELANSINLKASDLIKILSKLDKKTKYRETSILDSEITELALLEIGHIPIIESFSSVEKLIEEKIKAAQNFHTRAPVVTIMGHVDHGKTSLLDSMRRRYKENTSNVMDSESGGITQHIGAYQIFSKSGKPISFIDTPGHEAFTAIRARGSMITDIVILVVAADDGIMPQTIEAIRHAQSAKVPIIVAINKIDKQDANINHILNQLIQYDIITEENGGETIAMPISAKTGQNLDKLEEAILLVAEMIDLKADETIPAIGTIIEAKISPQKGPCATVLVQQGTLKIGDTLITNDKFCKVRSMFDENSINLQELKPSRAAEIFGFDEIPSVGQKFIVLENEKSAKSVLEKIIKDSDKQNLINEKKKNLEINEQGRVKTIFDLFKTAAKSHSGNSNSSKEEDQIKELNFVIKADVSGTIDAVKYSLEKLNNENDKIKINIIYSSTGAVTESDIMLAKSSSAMICGFNVGAQANIRNIMDREGLTFKTYTIIYQLIDDIKSLIENELKPKKIEKNIAKAFIKQIFDISGIGLIAGCEVKEGAIIMRNSFVRIKRNDRIIAEEILIKELKRGKENVREVASGLECGIALQDYDDILKGDILEIYQMIDNI